MPSSPQNSSVKPALISLIAGGLAGSVTFPESTVPARRELPTATLGTSPLLLELRELPREAHALVGEHGAPALHALFRQRHQILLAELAAYGVIDDL